MIGVPAGDPPLSTWRRMRLWAAAHAVDDLYQGLVPACVPYFVLDRHYGYVAASGLTLAATLGAALPQLVVGFLVDRYSLSWMAGARVSLAGIGLGMSGVLHGYALVWMTLFASGLGVAMFHPAAGQAARYAAGDSTSAMSIFATRRQRRVLPSSGPRGLAAPVFGAVAAAHGTQAVLTLLCLLPVPAVVLSLLLPEPISPSGMCAPPGRSLPRPRLPA